MPPVSRVGAARTDVGVGQVVAALVIGMAGYGASIVLWVKGARNLVAARGQVIFAAAPFIGAVIAWSVLGESVTAAQLMAVVIAAAGVGVSLESAHSPCTHSRYARRRQ